jgi:hypothetical protein
MRVSMLWFGFRMYSENGRPEQYVIGKYGDYAGHSDALVCSPSRSICEHLLVLVQLGQLKVSVA